ncbi:MAG TPA: hypothetical protein VFO71_07705 [Gemmatimonadales bacterium]|nr:hypothetical protein [Gemmatimonadales bacterium]
MRRGALILALLVLGCAPKPAQSPVIPEHDACRLADQPPGAPDTISVALLEPVDPDNAASPANDSERLLFRNLYDNLVHLDCQHEVRPGLAGLWTPAPGGNGWVLTLREGAELPSGIAMSAADVRGKIKALATSDRATLRALGIDSALALDAKRVQIVLREGAGDSAPRLLADPALAMTESVPPALGSEAGTIAISRRGNLPVIDFRFLLQRDPRDALDRDIDLVVTRDPLLVEYASSRSDFRVHPLPWSRTYALLEPENQAGGLAGSLDLTEIKSSLAKDVVRAGARAAEPPDWWSALGACPAGSPRPTASPSSRVAYHQDDDVARALAERAVALAPTSAGLRAVGLDAEAFAAAVRDGADRGYIVGLPRESLAPCRDRPLWPEGARLVPLIDTRGWAIVRKGAPPLTVEWDGTVRVVTP